MQNQRVGDIDVDLHAAGVLEGGPDSGRVDDLPLTVRSVVLSLDVGIQRDQVDDITGVCPGSEFHDAALLVEGEVFNVNAAGAAEDSGRFPGD